jgi:zinc transport system ATP-binding protein
VRSARVRRAQALTPPDEHNIDAVCVSGVYYRYPGAGSDALEDVTLHVRQGERLGILGPNGGGKSTLLKMVLGMLTPQRGSVTLMGLTPALARARGLIGYVPQRADPETMLPMTAREAVTTAAAWRLAPWKRPDTAMLDRIEETLELVGASGYAQRPLSKLSGGQLQRVLIARALVTSPKILALDEPTVGIDAAGQQRFAELLAAVHARTNVTLLTVTHDLRAIAAGSDTVACLARRLHSHTSPQGITPQVLAELFSHDIAGLHSLSHLQMPLAGAHVHAHGPDEACPHGSEAVPGKGTGQICTITIDEGLRKRGGT